MKVKVVNNNPKHGGIDYGTARNLTLGNVYEVLVENTELYTILNDINKEEGYIKERFEIVKGEEQMKVTLPNGMIVEGTPEQVKQVADYYGFKNLIGDDRYYNSSTHGLLLIKDMNTMHLRNAILKMYRDWTEKLSEIKNPQLLVRTIQNGIQDRTWLAMIREYSTRKEE